MRDTTINSLRTAARYARGVLLALYVGANELAHSDAFEGLEQIDHWLLIAAAVAHAGVSAINAAEDRNG